MKKALASLLTVLMVLTVGVGTVTATGNSNTSLNACTNEAEDYFGGVKVFARDKAKGPSRVMCPPTEEEVIVAAPGDREGSRGDRNLNARNKNRPPLEDIWNGFYKNIESLKLRAAAGCVVVAVLRGRNFEYTGTLINTDGAIPLTRRFEVPRRMDNRATKVGVAVACPAMDDIEPIE